MLFFNCFKTVEAAEDLGKENNNEDTFLDHAIAPAAVMGGGVGLVAESTMEGFYLFANMFKKDKKKEKVLCPHLLHKASISV